MTPEQQKALALARARRRRAEAESAPNAVVSGAEQLGSGINEGIAGFAGMPVDMMTGVLNAGIGGANSLFGSEINPITAPVGGSESIAGMLDPFISDKAPEGRAERYLRRGGQELGFGVPAALTGASLPKYGATARAALAPYMAASVAGDAGAGLAGQTAREWAPNSDIADVLASLVGGGAGAGVVAASLPAHVAVPSLDAQKATEASKWAAVKANPAQLTDPAMAALDARVKGALPTSQLAPEAYPSAFKMADTVGSLKNPTVYDVNEARRIIGDAVAGDPKEARVGVAMKKAIQEYLGGLTPNDVSGGSVDTVVDDLKIANKTSHQVAKAEAILNKEMRGETRAATSGTGGNETNAIRQNIRTIFDKERDPTLKGARQGFSPDEMAQMDRVVNGTTTQNIARLIGRMSPTSGALPLMFMGGGGVSGATASLLTGNPVFALPMIGAGAGMVAKSASEKMTRGEIDKLVAVILNGGKMPDASPARSAAMRAIAEQLMSAGAQ